MHYKQLPSCHEMRFESTEGRDQDAGRGFLADAASAPAPLQCPFLDRPLPSEHVPQAGSRRRGDAAARLDAAPYRPACSLDPQPGTLTIRVRAAFAKPQVRQVERPQRIE